MKSIILTMALVMSAFVQASPSKITASHISDEEALDQELDQHEQERLKAMELHHSLKSMTVETSKEAKAGQLELDDLDRDEAPVPADSTN